MSKKICLQKAHVNIKNNSIVSLRGSTGAPGEQNFTADIAERVKKLLIALGFEVYISDGNGNDDINVTSKDWDLYLSIHYDADIYGTGGGFVDYPEPSTDGATKESQRITKVLAEEYFKITKVKNVPTRSNANTRYYYMWKYLSAKTPCALIECGVGMHKPDDYNILQNNRDLVAGAIAAGVAKAFNVTNDPSNPIEDISPNKKLPDNFYTIEEAKTAIRLGLIEKDDAWDSTLSKYIKLYRDTDTKIKGLDKDLENKVSRIRDLTEELAKKPKEIIKEVEVIKEVIKEVEVPMPLSSLTWDDIINAALIKLGLRK